MFIFFLPKIPKDSMVNFDIPGIHYARSRPFFTSIEHIDYFLEGDIIIYNDSATPIF